MNQRLTRQEIKRDEVMEGLSRGVRFLREHGRSLAIAGVAVLVLLVGFGIWKAVSGARQTKANLALSQALEGVAEAGGDLAGAREALEDVVGRYGSTRPGAVASAYLGTIAARAGDFETARSRWEAFLETAGDHAMAAMVERNLMSLDRAEGKDEELAEKLRAALATGSSALAADALLYELGRTLEDLGQIAGASEIYGRLIEEYPTSVYSAEARERSSTLTSA